MKIEMGESIVYSWLKHVKGCQIVQNNWKVSPNWIFMNNADLEKIGNAVKEAFQGQYDVFKKNTIDQFIRQGECDAIGSDFQDETIYGVDVAFHRNGLNYGSRTETVAKIIEKCIRTAMCMYGYFNKKDAVVVFAAPKVTKKVASELSDAITKLKAVTDSLGYKFTFEIIINDDFKTKIVDDVLLISNRVDDTAELFLRSYQLLDLYYILKDRGKKSSTTVGVPESLVYSSFKIEQLANIVLRDKLEQGKITSKEIMEMQTKTYCKEQFHIQYPLLVETGTPVDSSKYYSEPVRIGNKEFYLCSQWYENKGNNDRPSLEAWLISH